MSYENAQKLLKKYGQEHLLQDYENLNEERKKFLLKQISEINFEEINELYKKAISDSKQEYKKIEPIEYIDKNKISKEERKKYQEIGINVVKKGKLAIVTMAGGQGTRLRA